MLPLSRSVAVSTVVGLFLVPLLVHARCRNQPGSPGYPSAADWSALNDSIDNRLVKVVPSAKACVDLGCTEAQWASGIFRQSIPGSMNAVGVLTVSLLGLPAYLSPVVVQLGTGNIYPSGSMVSIPLIERPHDHRITALHQRPVCAMGLPVRREMSLFMRSMPQLLHIFRFTSPPHR
jgi:hypothetical protein